MWAFWSVKEAGGGQNDPLTVFHMKDSAKIFNLIEVAEPYTLASGDFRSDQGQNEKKNHRKKF